MYEKSSVSNALFSASLASEGALKSKRE